MSKQNTHKEILSPSSSISEVVTLNGVGFFATIDYENLSSGTVKFYAGADTDFLKEVTTWSEAADTSANYDTFDYFTNAKYLKIELDGTGDFTAHLRVTKL